MVRRTSRARRARLAIAACVLWLAGVELLPAAHQGWHERLAPHRHDGGALVTVSFEDSTHRHPDGTIHFVAAAPPARARPHRALRRPRPTVPLVTERADHAAGLAHHAAAIAPAAPPVTAPLPVDRRPQILREARVLAPRVLDPLAATARGPPALASSSPT